jgi:hypothetical protein
MTRVRVAHGWTIYPGGRTVREGQIAKLADKTADELIAKGAVRVARWWQA